MKNWRETLDERQRKSIDFAEAYTRYYNHGAVGHNDMILIARLAAILDEQQDGEVEAIAHDETKQS